MPDVTDTPLRLRKGATNLRAILHCDTMSLPVSSSKAVVKLTKMEKPKDSVMTARSKRLMRHAVGPTERDLTP